MFKRGWVRFCVRTCLSACVSAALDINYSLELETGSKVEKGTAEEKSMYRFEEFDNHV